MAISLNIKNQLRSGLMEDRNVFILIFALSILDVLAIHACFFLVSLASVSPSAPQLNATFLMMICISWLISSMVNKLYRYNSVQTLGRMCYKVVLTYCCQIIILQLITFWWSNAHVDKMFYFYFLVAEGVALGLIRLLIRFTESRSVKLLSYRKTVAVVGNDELSAKLADFFDQNQRSFKFIGHFKTHEDSDLYGLQRNIRFGIDHKIDEVYSTVFPEEHEHFAGMVDMAKQRCIRVKFVTTAGAYQNKQRYDEIGGYNLVGHFNGMPVLQSRPEPLSLLRNRILKRAFDIGFSLFVIVFILSWLYPVLAVLIRLSSPGPTLFKQLRSGRNNKPFWCYKFRSMKVNANSNKQQATKNDKRVTKIGSFLRRSSMDELPQFFNVLIGNMSIVGPRPHMLRHTFEYQDVVDEYMLRLFSKPGITGWAQVNGFRGETKDPELMKNRVDYDIWYMENWRLTRDIKIVIMTISNVFKGEKTAY